MRIWMCWSLVSDITGVKCSLCGKFFQKIDFEGHVCRDKFGHEYFHEEQLKRQMVVTPE